MLLSLLSHNWKIGTATTLITTSPIGALLNITFLSIVWNKDIKLDQTVKILTTISIVDGLTCIIVSPLHIIQLIFGSLATECHWDNIRTYMSSSIISLSTFAICLLAIDRILLVERPFKPEFKTRNFYIIVAAMTVVATTPPISKFVNSPTGIKTYFILGTILGIMVLITLFSCYSILIRTIFKLKHNHPSGNNTLKEIRVTKISFTILTLHTILIIPILTYHICILKNHLDKNDLAKMYCVSFTAISLNAIIHPIVYQLQHTKIRTQFLIRLHLCAECRNRNKENNVRKIKHKPQLYTHGRYKTHHTGETRDVGMPYDSQRNKHKIKYEEVEMKELE